MINQVVTHVKATLSEPQLIGHMKRYTFAHIKQVDIATDIVKQMGSEYVRILGMKQTFVMPWTADRKGIWSLTECLEGFLYDADDQDVSLHAVDLHKVLFGYGKRGFGLVGESAYYNGPVIEDAIRLYFEPAQKPLKA